MRHFNPLRPSALTLLLPGLLASSGALAQDAAPAEAAEADARPLNEEGASKTYADVKSASQREKNARAAVSEYFGEVLHRPGGLTSDEVAHGAARISPRALAADAQVESAKSQVRQVKWQYAPRVTVTGSYTKLSPQPSVNSSGAGGSLVGTDAVPNADGSPRIIDPTQDTLLALDTTSSFQVLTNQWLLSAGVTLPLSDYVLSLSTALTGAKIAQEAAELNSQAERVTSAANARIAYYNWVRAVLEAREAEKSVERAQEQLDVITRQHQAGRAARADVLRSDAFLASAELDQRRANTREAIAREQVNILMTGGETAQPNWSIGEDIVAPPPPDWTETKSLEELEQEALSQRLEIKSLEKTIKALMDKAHLDKTNAWPKLQAFANLDYGNPNQRVIPQVDQWIATWNLGAQLTWTLNDLGIQYAEAAKTKADAAQRQAQIKEIEYAIRQEVVSEYRTLEEASLAVTAAERGFQASEAAYRDRVVLYQNGRATSLDLLESETALVRARLDVVASYIGQRISRARLDHALGRDISSPAVENAGKDTKD